MIFSMYFDVVISNAQTEQVKSGTGETLNIQPNVLTTQSYSAGYGLYATDGGVIYSGSGTVSTSGNSAAGLFAAEPDSIIYWQGTDIATSGFRGRGIDTVRGGQVIGYGTVTTNGERAHGVQAGDTNLTAGPASVTLLPATFIHTLGNGSYGLHAYATGTISGSANIVTEGVSSFGAHAEKDSSITINNSNIETHGVNAIGLIANTDGITAGVNYVPGKLTATSTIVKTTGDGAFGALADVEASIKLIDIDFETTGENAVGLLANRGGNIESRGNLSTKGVSAYGVAAGLVAVQGQIDRVKHSGNIVTNGDNAYGVFGQNSAQLDIAGSIKTSGQMSHGALIDGAKLNLENMVLRTEGDESFGLYAKNDASITGQANIVTQGVTAHGIVAEAGSTLSLYNAQIDTHGASADGLVIKKSAIALIDSQVSTNGRGLNVTDSSTIVLKNTSVQSKLSTIEANFTQDDGLINLGIDSSSNINSQNGVLLKVKRDSPSAQTGGVNLTIENNASIHGDFIDSDEKSSGYTDVSLGKDVTWSGSAQGVRNFKSIGGDNYVKFEGGSLLTGDLYGEHSIFSFQDMGISIARDVFLLNNSYASGGSEINPITVRGNMNVDATSTQSGSWLISGNLKNSGTISPGSSIGTVIIGGDFYSSDTSIYEVEINSNRQNDLIDIAGTGTLGGRVSLLTTGGADGFTVNHRYRILSAQGGLHGTTYAGGLKWNNASSFIYVVPTLTYDAQNVYLMLARNEVPIVTPEQTPNEQAVGGAIDNGGVDSALENAVLLQANEKAARYLLLRLSGEAHQSVLAAIQQNASHSRDNISDRLRAAFTEDGPVFWTRAINAQATSKSNSNYSRLKQSSNSLFVGADAVLGEGLRSGVMAGIEKAEFSVDELGSSAASDSYHLGVYGGWNYQDFKLRIGSVYSRHNISMDRSFTILKTQQSLESEYKAHTAQIFGEAGYEFRSSVIDAEPFVGLAYIQTRRDGFTEYARESLFDAALNAAPTDISNTVSTLGIRLGQQLTLRDGIQLKAYITPEWRHAYGDENANSQFTLDGNTIFEIGGLPIARDIFSIGTALDIAFNKTIDVNLTYAGQFGKEVTENSFKGLAKIKY